MGGSGFVIRKQDPFVAFIVLRLAIYANGMSLVHSVLCFSFRSSFLLMGINIVGVGFGW